MKRYLRLIPLLAVAALLIAVAAPKVFSSACVGAASTSTTIPTAAATVATCTPQSQTTGGQQQCIAIGTLQASASATPGTNQVAIVLPGAAVGSNCTGSTISPTASVNYQISQACAYTLPVGTAPSAVGMTVVGSTAVDTWLTSSNIVAMCAPIF